MKYTLPTIALMCLFFSAFSQTNTLLLDQTINIAGVTRGYHLYVPNNPINAPVVMLFHGHTSSNNGLLGLGGEKAPYKVWLDIAEQENILLLVPNGYQTSASSKGWNDCRADAATNSEEDDVLFISTLIDTIVATYQADADRVYANGTSNGGHLCIRLTQEIPEKIAAFAAIISANAVNSECQTSTLPVSALFMNGTADSIMPFAGGQMASNRGEVFSTENTVNYWVQRNGTDSNPIVTPIPNTFPDDDSEVIKYEYPNGTNNTCVVLYEVIGGGHTEPSPSERYNFPFVPLLLGNQNGDLEMAEAVWAFFEDKSNIVSNYADLFTNNQVNIFPNPVTDQLTIEFGTLQEKVLQLVLFNALGQQIDYYQGSQELINTNHLKPGMYFLKVDFEGRTITRTFIKQ